MKPTDPSRLDRVVLEARRAAERREQTYREHWLSPKLYDVCLNTDHLKPAEASYLVCEAARQR